jgi:hypothetical protein
MLMSALSNNPIHCLDCNLEVEPRTLPLPEAMVDAVANWGWIALAIHTLELDSGPYERWAQAELLDLESPVNRDGLDVREQLDGVRRCYFVLFQPLAADGFVVPDVCPSCGSSFSEYSGGRFKRMICEGCSLAIVSTQR